MFKDIAPQRRICRGRAYTLAPKKDFDDIDRFHETLVLVPEARRTRCRGFELRSKANGLTVGVGTSRSNPSRESSAFRTRKNVSIVEPLPDSRFLNAFSEMPALSAVET
ncbi:hypothetical protein SAMN05444167_1156 [Terriglobus roseus]|uniref:Uncharacterized protein n=1 Tax=Terriglobus roseus TaxID=392734 RepID=A0A1G7HNZ0_9BACT|nr:hypothetical protein SAMN05444167_1156 [Terriglobus roseus]